MSSDDDVEPQASVRGYACSDAQMASIWRTRSMTKTDEKPRVRCPEPPACALCDTSTRPRTPEFIDPAASSNRTRWQCVDCTRAMGGTPYLWVPYSGPVERPKLRVER